METKHCHKYKLGELMIANHNQTLVEQLCQLECCSVSVYRLAYGVMYIATHVPIAWRNY